MSALDVANVEPLFFASILASLKSHHVRNTDTPPPEDAMDAAVDDQRDGSGKRVPSIRHIITEYEQQLSSPPQSPLQRSLPVVRTTAGASRVGSRMQRSSVDAYGTPGPDSPLISPSLGRLSDETLPLVQGATLTNSTFTILSSESPVIDRSNFHLLFEAFLKEYHPAYSHANNNACSCADHLTKFISTPTYHGHSFDAYSLFAVIRELGGIRKVKSWTDVARRLGFVPKNSNISVRMKAWTERHHITPFFDHLLGIENPFCSSPQQHNLPFAADEPPSPPPSSPGSLKRKRDASSDCEDNFSTSSKQSKTEDNNTVDASASPADSEPSAVADSPKVTAANFPTLFEAFLDEFAPLCKNIGGCTMHDHVAGFNSPPSHHGRSFSPFKLFAVVSDLGGPREIKSWTEVTRRLGLASNYKHSNVSFKVKDWAERHHILAFYDFLLGSSATKSEALT